MQNCQAFAAFNVTINCVATRAEDFDAEMLADYRRCWRDPAMIQSISFRKARRA